MFCRKCGGKLQPEDDFCGSCGSAATTLSRAAPPASEQIPAKDSHNNLVTGFLKKNWAVVLILVVSAYVGINAWTKRAAQAKIIGCVETVDTYVVSGFVASARAMSAYMDANEECGAPWAWAPSFGTELALASQMCHESFLAELLARWAQFHSLDPPTCMYEITQVDLANGGFENLTTDYLTAGTQILKDYHKVQGSWLDRLWECENDLVNMDIVSGENPAVPVSCRILDEAYYHDLDELEKRGEYVKGFVDSVHAELGVED